MATSKRASSKRFEHINALCSKLFPIMKKKGLGTTSHKLVVMLCWRSSSGEGFKMSMVMLARMTGLSDRQCRSIMRDLEQWKIIVPDPDNNHPKAKAWTWNVVATGHTTFHVIDREGFLVPKEKEQSPKKEGGI